MVQSKTCCICKICSPLHPSLCIARSTDSGDYYFRMSQPLKHSIRLIVNIINEYRSRSWEYGCGNPLRWPCDTLYPQKLVLASLTSGGLSVGIVCLRTEATELHYYPNDDGSALFRNVGDLDATTSCPRTQYCSWWQPWGTLLKLGTFGNPKHVRCCPKSRSRLDTLTRAPTTKRWPY
jgi:hypothetical protein